FLSISYLAASPQDSVTLYAASGNKVWKSADAGATWSMLFQFPSSVSIFGLAVDPTNSTSLYAATSTVGVQKSIDGGTTWTPVNNGIPVLPNGTTNVQSVWIDPSSPDVIFASSGYGLSRSADGGGTWTQVASGSAYSPLAFDPSVTGNVYFGSGNDILKST